MHENDSHFYDLRSIFTTFGFMLPLNDDTDVVLKVFPCRYYLKFILPNESQLLRKGNTCIMPATRKLLFLKLASVW